MNWDAIGASAELVGALATVATLAYLALQIRQNTKVAGLPPRHPDIIGVEGGTP